MATRISISTVTTPTPNSQSKRDSRHTKCSPPNRPRQTKTPQFPAFPSLRPFWQIQGKDCKMDATCSIVRLELPLLIASLCVLLMRFAYRIDVKCHIRAVRILSIDELLLVWSGKARSRSSRGSDSPPGGISLALLQTQMSETSH